MVGVVLVTVLESSGNLPTRSRSWTNHPEQIRHLDSQPRRHGDSRLTARPCGSPALASAWCKASPSTRGALPTELIESSSLGDGTKLTDVYNLSQSWSELKLPVRNSWRKKQEKNSELSIILHIANALKNGKKVMNMLIKCTHMAQFLISTLESLACDESLCRSLKGPCAGSLICNMQDYENYVLL